MSPPRWGCVYRLSPIELEKSLVFRYKAISTGYPQMGCQLVRIMFLRGRQIGCTSAKVMSNPACGSPGPDSLGPLSGKNSSGGDRRSYRWSQRRILEEIRPNPIFRGHSLTVLGQNKWSSLLKFKSRY